MATLRARGVDPLAQKAQAKAEAAMQYWTFAEAAEAFLAHINKQRGNTKFPLHSAAVWESSLHRFVLPKIGAFDCRAIRHEHVAAILAPIAVVVGKTKVEGKGGPSVAARLRSRIERVLDYAAVNGRRDPNLPNPASPRLFKDVLGAAPPTKHHAAPTLEEAPCLFQRIATTPGTVYRAAQWIILSASRLRETLDATFDEVDLTARTWTIPAFLARRVGCVSGKDLDPSHIVFLPELVAAGEKKQPPPRSAINRADQWVTVARPRTGVAGKFVHL
jgi:integrase